MKTRKKRLKRVMDIDNPALRFFSYALLVLITIAVLVPLYIVVSLSFKTLAEANNSNVFALPESFGYLDNYIFIWTRGKLLRGFKNTGILIITSLIGSITMGTMVAYVLSRFEFKLKKAVYILFMFPIVVPAVTTQVATFTIVRSLGLYNTIWAGIILYISTDMLLIYIFLQHIEKIPVSLDESARTDGASYWTIYRKIILPQLRPAIVTGIIIKTLTIYNDLFTPYLYMPKSRLKTVTTSILAFVADRTSDWGVVSAGIVSAIVPTVILYLLLQKYIISGVVDGAVKA